MVWTAAWTDFVICLLFGWVGVHKFREKKFSMGILYLFTMGLFSIGWIVDTIRYLIAAINGERIQGNRPLQLSNNDELPIITSSNLLLSNGETCHYSGSATFIKSKNVVVGYSSGHSGVSIRVAKGMSYRVGASKASPIRGDVQERTVGTLTITNKRVVFSANRGAFDKKIVNLSSVTPYSDGLAFQFGSQQYPLEIKNPTYVYQILARIVNTSPDDPDRVTE